MALIRWRNDLFNPFNDLDRLQDDINQLFNGTRGPAPQQGIFDRTISPAIDTVETKNEFVVMCDLPGVSGGDLDITVTKDVLTIKGEKKGEAKKEESQYYRRESWSGSFQRTIALPTGIDSNKVEADFNSGVLEVKLPKREEVKPKQISIKAH